MSLTFDDDDNKPTAHTPSIPLDLNGNIITWNKNLASVSGRLEALFDAFERDNTFPLLFEHRASFKSGRIYVESIETVSFLINKSVSTTKYGFHDVCPPTPARNAAFSTERAAAVTAGDTHKVSAMGAELITTMPADLSRNYIVSPAQVAADKADLLKILAAIFKGTPWCTKKIKEAKGDGLVYLDELKKKAAAADINDKTAVIAHFEKVKSGGISGELNEATISEFLTRYEMAKLDAEICCRRVLCSSH